MLYLNVSSEKTKLNMLGFFGLVSLPCLVGWGECPCTVDQLDLKQTQLLAAWLALPQWATEVKQRGDTNNSLYEQINSKEGILDFYLKYRCENSSKNCWNMNATFCGGSSELFSSLALVLDAQADKSSSWYWRFSISFSRTSISSWRSGSALDT